MLTAADESNLLTAPFSGRLEEPYWTSFLDHLLKRTKADHAWMIIARPGQPVTDAPRWFAGREFADPQRGAAGAPAGGGAQLAGGG